jgi:hypothetical protein
VIGDEEDISRSATPVPKGKDESASATSSPAVGPGEEKDTEEAEKLAEIPDEIKLRLRRLDKLEPKYGGM